MGRKVMSICAIYACVDVSENIERDKDALRMSTKPPQPSGDKVFVMFFLVLLCAPIRFLAIGGDFDKGLAALKREAEQTTP